MTPITILQSAADARPDWVSRCMRSVADWSQQQGYDYHCIGDELFGWVGHSPAQVGTSFEGALRIRERKMAQDRREEARDNALGEYTRRGYEPPSDRAAETRALSFSSSSSDDADYAPGEIPEAAAEPSSSWLQLICPWAPWRQ